MLTSSSKAKGRKLQTSVTLKFRDIFKDILEKEDIKSTNSSISGIDVTLSPSAKHLIAFDCECKNVEKLVGAALSNAIKQCENNSGENRIPLLIFKKNNDIERVILKLDDFFRLIYPKENITISMDNIQKIIVQLEILKQEIIKNSKTNRIVF